jgi:hypothetical protein
MFKQAAGHASSLARAALLAAVVSGKGGRSSRVCPSEWIDAAQRTI